MINRSANFVSFHALDIVEERQFCLLSCIFWPQLAFKSVPIIISSFFIFPQIFNRMFGGYIYMYIVSDQGIFPLGAKLWCWGILILGIDWSLLYSRHKALNKNKVHRHLVFLSRYTDACGGHLCANLHVSSRKLYVYAWLGTCRQYTVLMLPVLH